MHHMRTREWIDTTAAGEAHGVLWAQTHLACPRQSSTAAGTHFSRELNQNQGLQQTQRQDILSPGQGVIPLHMLVGTLGALQDPAVCPRICTSIQHGNNPNLVWRPGAPAKIAFLADWAEENSSLPLLSPPHPPKTPANAFCPPPPSPSSCKANFQQPQTQLLGSKFPPILEVRAVTPPVLCLSCWDGVCFSQRAFCGCSAWLLTARGTVPHSQVIWIGIHQEVCFHLLCRRVGVQTVTSFSAGSTPLNGDFHIHQAWKNIAIF